MEMLKYESTIYTEGLDPWRERMLGVMGDVGWYHPDIMDGKKPFAFGSPDNERHVTEMQRRCAEWYDGADPGQAAHEDRRGTRGDVMQVIEELDAARTGCQYGTFDEGYHAFGWDHDNPWTSDYRWLKVYVVHGGNEGYWLHVDMVQPDASGNDIHKTMFTAKSLGHSWSQCWRMAADIAYVLGA